MISAKELNKRTQNIKTPTLGVLTSLEVTKDNVENVLKSLSETGHFHADLYILDDVVHILEDLDNSGYRLKYAGGAYLRVSWSSESLEETNKK